MIKENRLDTVIKTEKRTNVYNLKMKENRFFDNVYRYSMVDPFILTTPVFKVIEENFKSAIQEGLAYI